MNPLSGIEPQDGDMYELSREEVLTLIPNAEQNMPEELQIFWACMADDPGTESIELPLRLGENIAWDIFGAENEEGAPWVWISQDNAWRDTTRF